MAVTDPVLVVDVGTSSVRVAVVDGDAQIRAEQREPLLPSSPAPGLVEFDAARLAEIVRRLAVAAVDAHGPVAAVGIANQRGTSVLWDRATGAPVGPAIVWQDLRTVGRCLELRADGLQIGPTSPRRSSKRSSSRPTRRGRVTCASAPSTAGSPGPCPTGHST